MAAPPDAETCETCAFDGARWSDTDAVRTLDHAGDLVRLGLDGCDPAIVHRRPDPATWSIVEYVDHLREVVFANHLVAAVAATEPGTDLGTSGSGDGPIADEPLDLPLVEAIAGLEREGRSFVETLRSLDPEAWASTAVVGGDPEWSVGWCARHACHDLLHHLADIAAIRAALDAPFAPMDGTVASLHAGGGGVPKPAVDRATIDGGGVVGDRQATRRHHGRQWQGLCLWSADVVDALREEGHPIERGSAGENVSIAGVDWTRLRAGLVVELGEVRCRVVSPAPPCAKNHRWFADGSSRRIDHDLHPGWSRWYALVESPGTVSPGDPVTIATT